MTTPTVRTASHEYPQEELNAMSQFYNGIILNAAHNVEWFHLLDATDSEGGHVRRRSSHITYIQLNIRQLALSDA